jgi:hypothetical protein
MRRLARGLLVAVILAGAATGVAAERVRLPPGTRAADAGAHRSGRSFKDTVEFYGRLLSRDGIPHELVGPYRRRGVLVARFVATRPRAPWQAIHVWNRAGQTFIFVVPPSPGP